MKKILVLVIVGFFSFNSQAQRSELIESLPILEVINKRFYNVLDHIIEHEKECDYYTSNLKFNIFIRLYKDIVDVQIDAIGNKFGKHEMDTIKNVGIFEYKEHLFLVEGEIEETIFSITSDKKECAFQVLKNYIDSDTGELILMIIEDDSYSYWNYEYVSNNFIL